mmetsp:Transcript_15354/g.25959  ORF Transcript_15354/g.25959 Transcript_15354/m.25959 type:complete len:134 (+) Transcript_15354:979-1380(+)
MCGIEKDRQVRNSGIFGQPSNSSMKKRRDGSFSSGLSQRKRKIPRMEAMMDEERANAEAKGSDGLRLQSEEAIDPRFKPSEHGFDEEDTSFVTDSNELRLNIDLSHQSHAAQNMQDPFFLSLPQKGGLVSDED